jgi:hypothetical protein
MDAREAKQREQRKNDLESERDSEEGEEESWINTLVEGIIEPNNYRNREERIINFLENAYLLRFIIWSIHSEKEK